MFAPKLKTTQLGQTSLRITPVGFGAWALSGGGWEVGWGLRDDDQLTAAIHRALEHGVNWIDTAAAYGFGLSERIVGRALQGVAERPYVFTKCSLLESHNGSVIHNLTRDSILREAEGSLKRLGLDAIDVYQLHWPIPATDIREGWAAMAELKDQGLVRHIGVANFDVAQLREIQQIAPVETLQPQYSLIERGAEPEILPFAQREGMGVIVYSPMGSGKMIQTLIKELPADEWRTHNPRFTDLQRSHNLELVERLTTVAGRYGVTPSAVAVAWTLRHPSVDGAIVGFRHPSQVDPILNAAWLALTDEDVAEIDGAMR